MRRTAIRWLWKLCSVYPALVAPNFTNQFPKHTPLIYLCSLTDGPVPNSFHWIGQGFCVGQVVVLKQNEKCLYSTRVSQCLHFSRQWPYKCLNFNAEKWHFTFNYSRIYPHITHIHILIYFLAHSLGWQVKMYSSLIQHIAKGCLRELMSFSTVCTNTLTHSIRFPPYDSVSLQSYSDLREPKGAAPWVSRPDQ